MKRINLNRLQPKFIDILNKYMAEHEMSQVALAKKVGINRPRLNALLNPQSKIQLTAYYILKFIRIGVFSVADIKDNCPKNDRESEFWNSASEAENFALLKKLAIARNIGIEFESILDGMIKAHTPERAHH